MAKKSSSKSGGKKQAAKKSASKKSTKGKGKTTPEMSWLRRQLHYLPAWLMLAFIVMLFVGSNLGITVPGFDTERGSEISTITGNPQTTYAGTHNTAAPLTPFYSESVLYWEPKIYQWAEENELNPNIVAILMQIESCGHPYAGSGFANGLFQVTPANFNSLVNNQFQTSIGVLEPGTNQLNPDYNAAAGLYIFSIDCLLFAGDDLEAAFACYNGGPNAVNPNNRFQETIDYVVWSMGIWGEASRGAATSATLNRWLNSGGSMLCDSAEAALERLDPLNRYD